MICNPIFHSILYPINFRRKWNFIFWQSKSKKGKEIGIEHLYNNTLINLASSCQKAEEK